tara:strand:- start:229 stop:801 length:573 start_codon:yes stop_codon:yes gene_type:complete
MAVNTDEALRTALQWGTTGAMSGNPWLAAGAGLAGLAWGGVGPESSSAAARRVGESLMSPDLQAQRLQMKTGPDTSQALRTAINRQTTGGPYGVPQYSLSGAYNAMSKARSEEAAKTWQQQQEQNFKNRQLGAQMLSGAASGDAALAAAQYGTEGAWYNDPTSFWKAMDKDGEAGTDVDPNEKKAIGGKP